MRLPWQSTHLPVQPEKPRLTIVMGGGMDRGTSPPGLTELSGSLTLFEGLAELTLSHEDVCLRLFSLFVLIPRWTETAAHTGWWASLGPGPYPPETGPTFTSLPFLRAQAVIPPWLDSVRVPAELEGGPQARKTCLLLASPRVHGSPCFVMSRDAPIIAQHGLYRDTLPSRSRAVGGSIFMPVQTRIY